MTCEYAEIPKHLHANGRSPEMHFRPTEFLFRRGDFDRELHISKISLAHLSVNRSGTKDLFFSEAEDARHFVDAEGSYHCFSGSIDTLLLDDSGLENGNSKIYSERYEVNGKEVIACAQVMLCQVPEPCNYAHSTFEFEYNGKRMIAFPREENTLSQGRGKKAKYVGRLRAAIRDDISKMIQEDW